MRKNLLHAVIRLHGDCTSGSPTWHIVYACVEETSRVRKRAVDHLLWKILFTSEVKEPYDYEKLFSCKWLHGKRRMERTQSVSSNEDHGDWRNTLRKLSNHDKGFQTCLSLEIFICRISWSVYGQRLLMKEGWTYDECLWRADMTKSHWC